MAIFGKNEAAPQKPRERTPFGVRGIAGEGAISIVATGMIMTGDVVTDGIIRIEGEVRGTVRAGKAVLLGPAGRVDGDILTEEAVIGGTVTRTIVANGRLELQSTCAVFGEIISRAQHLKLEEGAKFAGEVKLLDAEDPMSVVDSDSKESREYRADGALKSIAEAESSIYSEEADARVA